jgi:glycosyltransferase involved in cell wall biosynthesis
VTVSSKPLRIGLNGIRLIPGYKGGINSFAFGLFDAFAAGGRGHCFVIFATAHNRHLFQRYESHPNFRILLLDGLLPRLGRGLFNRIPPSLRFHLPHRTLGRLMNRADVLRIAGAVDVQYVPHCPTPIYPFADIPTLYSIHDLQHVHFPTFFSQNERRGRDVALANTVRHAAMIQASSRQMADEFAAHFPGLEKDRIVIIPEGVDVTAFAQASAGDVRARYGLPGRFLFYPAQLWPHKNHITIVKALAELRKQGIEIPLVLTGAPYAGVNDLSSHLDAAPPNGIHYLGLVPYADIIALHRAARFLITASLYEASSIPVLEAAAADTAIIASATPSHVEHAQHLQMNLFAPTDVAALVELLRAIWNDDALIARQTAHNNVAVLDFSWAKAAERYLDRLENMAGRVRGSD